MKNPNNDKIIIGKKIVYKDNKIYKLSRLALNKTKISDLVRVGEESSNLVNNFSVDINI